MDVLPALTATTFHRHNRSLRAVMIDNQPWFVGTDYARLLGLHHPPFSPAALKKARSAAFSC